MDINELLEKINKLKSKVEDDGNGEELRGKIADLREYFIYNLAYNLLQNEDEELKELHIEETQNILHDFNEIENYECVDYEDSKVVNVWHNPMGYYHVEE